MSGRTRRPGMVRMGAMRTGAMRTGNTHRRPGRRRVFKLHLRSAINVRRLFVAAFLLYLVGIVTIQEANLALIRRDTHLIAAQLKEARRINEDFDEKLRALQTDAFMEALAREEFGLIKPGEIPIIPIPAR